MKSLNTYIQEKLIVNKSYKSYKYFPKTWEELRQIIIDRYEEQGPGTKKKPIDFNDINVSRIDTFYSVSNFKGIFEKMEFEYIDVSDWDVSNVKNMHFTFLGCIKLKSVGDLSNWDVSKVENISLMFAGCKNLKSVGDLSNWDISNVKDMNSMFHRSKINTPDWYKE